MRKFKIFVDMEEEEKYLNTMAKSGYALQEYSSLGVYTFIETTPKDLHYKIDYRTFNRKRDFNQYIALFEDSGWIHISGTPYSGSQYFLPGSGNTDSPDIFSDESSRAARYKRLFNQCLIFLVLSLTYFIAILSPHGFNLGELGYLTPGLWERTGYKFWFSFLFETPFVILRFLPFFLLIMIAFIYGYWAYKAQMLYRRSLKRSKNGCL